jgi:hypothetical protein
MVEIEKREIGEREREKWKRDVVFLLLGMERNCKERPENCGPQYFFISLLACEERVERGTQLCIFHFCHFLSTIKTFLCCKFASVINWRQHTKCTILQPFKMGAV